MPKTSGMPPSVLADINRLKARLATLEKNHNALIKDFEHTMRSHAGLLNEQQNAIALQNATIAQLGKKSTKKAKRRPSEYNLFLKGKMSQGMTMIDAVKAWRETRSGMPIPPPEDEQRPRHPAE